MNYKSYQNMRNATWQILLDSKVDRLPIDMICYTLAVLVCLDKRIVTIS